MVDYHYLANVFTYHLSSSCGGCGGAANRINIIITNNTSVVVVVVVIVVSVVGEGHAQAAPTNEQHINIFKTNAGSLINQQRASLPAGGRNVGVGRHCLIALDPMKIGGRRDSGLKEREDDDGGDGGGG